MVGNGRKELEGKLEGLNKNLRYTACVSMRLFIVTEGMRTNAMACY